MASHPSTTTPEWGAARVRQTFLDYFQARGHTFVPSSSVVPLADPTLSSPTRA